MLSMHYLPPDRHVRAWRTHITRSANGKKRAAERGARLGRQAIAGMTSPILAPENDWSSGHLRLRYFVEVQRGAVTCFENVFVAPGGAAHQVMEELRAPYAEREAQNAERAAARRRGDRWLRRAGVAEQECPYGHGEPDYCYRARRGHR